MTSYYFMQYPECSTQRDRVEPLPEMERDNPGASFRYVYGNNDRRDDRLRTKKALSEKYGIKFYGPEIVPFIGADA